MAGTDAAQPASESAGQGASMTASQRLRAIIGGSAGNLVEYYDWFAYSFFALYFAPVFFPKGDQTAQLLQSAAVFAAGFFARPIGGWLMGILSDRYGRRDVLMGSIIVMSIGSLIIALTPGYDQIGAAAPLILVAARILQGISIGGEYGVSATYLSEVANRAHRGFWSSFQLVTIIAGQLTALAVLLVLQRILTPEELQAWGWRVPFFIGAGLAIVVFFMRRGLAESESFLNAKSQNAPPPRTAHLFTTYRREMLITFGISIAGSLQFYALANYAQKFLVITSGFSKDDATEIVAIGLVFLMLIQPAIGALSDKWGRRAPLLLSFGITALFAWPFYNILGATQDKGLAILMVCASMIVVSGYTAVSAIVKAELFPAHIRALGVSLPFAVASSVFGGGAEYIALWFKANGIEQGFSIFMIVTCVVGFLTVLLMRESKTTSKIIEA
jgi:MFS transporter, MHS family, alpha-ketoglutarate permease